MMMQEALSGSVIVPGHPMAGTSLTRLVTSTPSWLPPLEPRMPGPQTPSLGAHARTGGALSQLGELRPTSSESRQRRWRRWLHPRRDSTSRLRHWGWATVSNDGLSMDDWIMAATLAATLASSIAKAKVTSQSTASYTPQEDKILCLAWLDGIMATTLAATLASSIAKAKVTSQSTASYTPQEDWWPTSIEGVS
jgi:hypothetical protein